MANPAKFEHVSAAHREHPEQHEQKPTLTAPDHRRRNDHQCHSLRFRTPRQPGNAVADETEEKYALLEEGVKIVRDIVKQASEFGRRRVQRGYLA